MKSILVIGMGRFGKHLALKLLELGNEVMIVDQDEERLSLMRPCLPIPILATAVTKRYCVRWESIILTYVLWPLAKTFRRRWRLPRCCGKWAQNTLFPGPTATGRPDFCLKSAPTSGLSRARNCRAAGAPL